MSRSTAALAIALILLLSGCAVQRRVRAYNARVQAECLEKHTAEQCKPLAYPSCEPAPFGGEECR